MHIIKMQTLPICSMLSTTKSCVSFLYKIYSMKTNATYIQNESFYDTVGLQDELLQQIQEVCTVKYMSIYYKF
jgi:hypothetical protein